VKIKLQSNLSTGMLPIAQHSAAKYQLRKVLNHLPKGTQAYIAGGAPRDWHHGWGCRDIDIFFKTPDDFNSLTKTSKYLEQFKLQGKAYGEYCYGVDDSQGVLSIHEYPIYQGSLRSRTVQLIRLKKDPLDIIKAFPINMSRIWMDKSGRIECDPLYNLGYTGRFITQCNFSQWPYPYLNKILTRYHQYAYIPVNWEGSRNKA